MSQFKEQSFPGVKYGEKEGRLVVKPDRVQWIPLKTTTTLIIPFSEFGRKQYHHLFTFSIESLHLSIKDCSSN
jgi:hypothetical protein